MTSSEDVISHVASDLLMFESKREDEFIDISQGVKEQLNQHKDRRVAARLSAGTPIMDDFISLESTPSPSTSTTKKLGRIASRLLATSTTTSTSTSTSSSTTEEEIDPRIHAPWMGDKMGYRHDEWTLRLHEEILDFCAYISPVASEHTRRQQVIDKLEGVCKEIWPTSHITPFGSYATRLYLPISDIDVVLFDAQDDYTTGRSALEVLAYELKQRNMVSYIEVIASARIPIIKLTDRETNIRIDISFDIIGGIRAASWINTVVQQLPAIRPLTLLLKYFLHCRQLNDTYTGGIGSFLLQLMIISHLQMHPSRTPSTYTSHGSKSLSRTFDSDTNLGVLLLSFLELYGKGFNYMHVGISVTNGGSYFSKHERDWFNEDRPYLLSMENPLDDEHDVGSNSFAILRIRRAFYYAYQHLTTCHHHVIERHNTIVTSSHDNTHVKIDDEGNTKDVEKKPFRSRHTRTSHGLYPSILATILTVDEELLQHRPYSHQPDKQISTSSSISTSSLSSSKSQTSSTKSRTSHTHCTSSNTSTSTSSSSSSSTIATSSTSISISDSSSSTPSTSASTSSPAIDLTSDPPLSSSVTVDLTGTSVDDDSAPPTTSSKRNPTLKRSKKKKKLLRGGVPNGKGSSQPNNAIFESNRSKKRKKAAKKSEKAKKKAKIQ